MAIYDETECSLVSSQHAQLTVADLCLSPSLSPNLEKFENKVSLEQRGGDCLSVSVGKAGCLNFERNFYHTKGMEYTKKGVYNFFLKDQ